jgi:hypothetical protein
VSGNFGLTSNLWLQITYYNIYIYICIYIYIYIYAYITAYIYIYIYALENTINVHLDPYKRALWKPGMPEYHGIWRNITEYAGKSRNMPEYHGISRNMTEYHDIFPEYTWTSRYFSMVATRLFINIDVWQHILVTKVMDLSHFDGK